MKRLMFPMQFEPSRSRAVFLLFNFSLCLLAVPSSVLGEGVMLSPTTAVHREFVAGELLLGELNCTACHRAESAVLERLSPKQGPLLKEVGSRVTPQYLRAFLSDPQSVKPGSPMPDLLHGLEPSARAETVDALVHFLSSRVSTNPPALSGASPHLIQQGKTLYHSIGCVACHAPQEPSGTATAEVISALTSLSVPLGPLAKKTTLDGLARFLQDPLAVRPSGRMPSLNLTRGEAMAIAAYLLREQAASRTQGPEVKMPGLHYEYYEMAFQNTAGLDSATPVSIGSVEQINLSPKRRTQEIGFRFTGMIAVPRDAQYTFYVTSDDGSKLWIDGKVLVENDGIHAPQEKSGAVKLNAGEHTFALSYFNGGAGAELSVVWQEAGKSKRPIPAAALSHSGRSLVPLNQEDLVLDPAKVLKGAELFTSLRCVACHETGTPNLAAAGLKAPTLVALNPSASQGCLGSPKSGVPRFALSASQQSALREVLGNTKQLGTPLEPKARVSRTLAALNCFACHSRDGVGGPEGARGDFFTTVDNADLGDEGRIPPHLTGVGDKLKSDWIRNVLLQRGVARPYMATRMPQFGAVALRSLAEAFDAADARLPQGPAEIAPQDAKFGRQLVGTGGVSCIACHTFGGHKSLGIPALDLTLMTQRLKHDWFVRYLPDPAALRPGTRMPTFWPDGKAANQDILGGDPRHQIEAIWAFLSAGKAAKLPDGLIATSLELVADKEAVIYRHFIEGSGSRAIGVGYPEKANLSFDANNLRLALLWHGKFIDAGNHRRDRGTGYEGPLGDDIVTLPEGAPLARLADSNSPWPLPSGKGAGYQMKGYRLDEKQRPTFLFTFEGIHVEDYSIAVPREPEPSFLRTLSFKSDAPLPQLWFRAAVGNTIAAKNGGYLVEDRMVLRFQLPAGSEPLVRQSQGRMELLVPVRATGNETKIVEEIVW